LSPTLNYAAVQDGLETTLTQAARIAGVLYLVNGVTGFFGNI
jgi:hypothetical protein